MPIVRVFGYLACGIATMLICHFLSTGGFSHSSEKIVTGGLIGLWVASVDEVKRRRTKNKTRI